jgi:hypothetical protein
MSGYNFGGNTGRGRKGTRPSLAERINRVEYSPKPQEHLQTLQGQLSSCTDECTRTVIKEAISITQRLSQTISHKTQAYRPHNAHY